MFLKRTIATRQTFRTTGSRTSPRKLGVPVRCARACCLTLSAGVSHDAIRLPAQVQESTSTRTCITTLQTSDKEEQRTTFVAWVETISRYIARRPTSSEVGDLRSKARACGLSSSHHTTHVSACFPYANKLASRKHSLTLNVNFPSYHPFKFTSHVMYTTLCCRCDLYCKLITYEGACSLSELSLPGTPSELPEAGLACENWVSR